MSANFTSLHRVNQLIASYFTGFDFCQVHSYSFQCITSNKGKIGKEKSILYDHFDVT